MPLVRAVPILLAVALFLALGSAASHAALLGTNLIVDGHADSFYKPVGTTGVTVISIVNVDVNIDLGPYRHIVFSGGPSNAYSSMSQSIDISGLAPSIDAGVVTFDLSAYLGGLGAEDDFATLSVAFAPNGGTVGATPATALVITGPSSTGRGGVTGLLPVEGTGVVPVGSRSAIVTFSATRLEGSYNDGYGDDLSLILSAAEAAPAIPAAPTDVPEPAAIGILAVALGLASLRRLIRRP